MSVSGPSAIRATTLDPVRCRDDFPILSVPHPSGFPLAYLDNAASTQHPRQVIAALDAVYERSYANVHRGIYWLSELCSERYEQSRSRVARWIGAANEREIVFTRGTTESINLVARSWADAQLRPGDEIVLTLAEHHSNIVPWQQAAARTGARIRWTGLTADGELDLESFSAQLSERTRLVAVTAVSNVLGTRVPVADVVTRARVVGAVVLVDAAQAAPHQPLDVRAWDADFVAFSGHKLLGPTGIGVLYGREALLEAMPPFQGGGSMISRVRLDGFEPAELPAKFEAGTPPIAEAIGLAAAIDYLDAVGLPQIAEHEHGLVERAHQVLAEVGGVRLLGPAPAAKAGIVSFLVDGVHAHDVAQILDRRGIAIRAGHHCAMPLHQHLGAAATSRASFYLYNTIEEVDRLGEALREVKRVFRK